MCLYVCVRVWLCVLSMSVCLHVCISVYNCALPYLCASLLIRIHAFPPPHLIHVIGFPLASHISQHSGLPPPRSIPSPFTLVTSCSFPLTHLSPISLLPFASVIIYPMHCPPSLLHCWLLHDHSFYQRVLVYVCLYIPLCGIFLLPLFLMFNSLLSNRLNFFLLSVFFFLFRCECLFNSSARYFMIKFEIM